MSEREREEQRKTTYTTRCGLCNAESPGYPSSELLERWATEHSTAHGPEHEQSVRQAALAGWYRDMSTVDLEDHGPHVMPDLEDDDQ